MKKSLTDKVFVFDNVLNLNECNKLVEYYNYKGASHKWGTFYPLRMYYHEIPQEIAECFLKIETIVSGACNNLIEIDWCEIVKWPTNSFMETHKDTASDQTVFTSITYLNTDYAGGQTYITDNNIKFIPEAGKTICFDGKLYSHGVSKIMSGDRYTIPIWYKTT